jgi:hypothetical protein
MFGCSEVVMGRIAALLGTTAEVLKTSGLDLDVLEGARMLVENDINLDDREAVRHAVVETLPRPGFLEAATLLARDLHEVQRLADQLRVWAEGQLKDGASPSCLAQAMISEGCRLANQCGESSLAIETVDRFDD